jgi:hypothetical protein
VEFDELPSDGCFWLREKFSSQAEAKKWGKEHKVSLMRDAEKDIDLA